MKQLSVRWKIISLVLLIMIIGIGTLTFINTQRVSSTTEKSIIAQTEALSEGVEQTVTTYLESYEKQLHLLSTEPALLTYTVQNKAHNDDAQAAYRPRLNAFITTNPDATAIYVANGVSTIIEPHVEAIKDIDSTTRTWYEEAVATPGDVIWTAPYEDSMSGRLMITGAIALPDNKTVIGVDLLLDTLVSMMNDLPFGHGGFPIIIDEQATAIVHPTRSGESLESIPFVNDILNSADDTAFLNESYEDQPALIMYNKMSSIDWIINIVYFEDEVYSDIGALQMFMLLFTVIIVIVMIVALYFAITHMLKPLQVVGHSLEKMAAGDLTAHVHIKTHDEFETLGKHYNDMSDHMRDMMRTVRTSANDVEARSLHVSSISEETAASSQEMLSAVNAISDDASTTAETSKQALLHTQQLATQMQQMSTATAAIHTLTTDATSLNANGEQKMHELQETFKQSAVTLHELTTAVQTLTEKVNSIDSVMTTIMSIADQTNLLALNASIEAARAGDAGKGFAVVADEVRKLAEQSATATVDVRNTIQQLQHETHAVTTQMSLIERDVSSQSEAVVETEAVFTQISGVIASIDDRFTETMTQIDAMLHFKDAIVEEIERTVQATSSTAAACEQMSATSDEQFIAIRAIASAAEDLNELSEQLNVQMKRFTIE